MSYEYLVASFPTLAIDDPPPFDLAAFTEDCRRHLTEGDAEDLRCLLELDGAHASGPFAREWIHTEIQIRNQLARLRADRLNIQIDERKVLRDYAGYSAFAADAVEQAMSLEDPLQREKAIDLFRWRLADELALSDPFGLSAVLAFTVKLRIAQRWAGLTEAKGRENLDQLLDAVSSSSGGERGWLASIH